MSHDELLKRAKELGVPTDSGIYKPKNQAVDQLGIKSTKPAAKCWLASPST
jgi:hypothetical protein